MRREDPCQANRTEKDTLERAPPRLVGGGRDGSGRRPSNADQRTIQATEPVLGRRDQALGRRNVRVVGGEPSDAIGDARVVREASRRRRRGSLARGAHDDPRALGHESVSRRESQAATAARDEVDPLAQLEIHLLPRHGAYGREPPARGVYGSRRARRGSTELLGQSDDEALWATQEAQPVAVLVLRDLADELGTVAAQASDDVVEVL